MSISFDKALGIAPTALMLRDRRTQVLSENIANADTPNYKAQDVDFREMLKKVQNKSLHRVETTHAGHMNPDSGVVPDRYMKYRVPDQPSMDGNTVDMHREKAAFGRNALQMQASLRFVNGKFSGLISALKGK
jgi:flagellar basal-body rod protein FlgB